MRKPKLKRLGGDDTRPPHITRLRLSYEKGVPMECGDCDYKFVTPQSLEVDKCRLCGSTKRILHRTLTAFPEVKHGIF